MSLLFEDNAKILFIGDSISDYNRARPVGEGKDGEWGTSYVSDAACLLTGCYPEKHFRVVNMGIDGNTVVDLQNRWQTDVLDLAPDYVSVLIGINDVWRQFDSPEIAETHVPIDVYEKTYEALIQTTLKTAKGMILMTPYFMEPNKNDAMRVQMDRYGAVVKKLAEKYNLVFVDLQAMWDEYFTHVHPCSMAWDRVHPNIVGAMLIARQFLHAVGFDRF